MSKSGNAYMTYTFSGDAIGVYGFVGKNEADIQAQRDAYKALITPQCNSMAVYEVPVGVRYIIFCIFSSI
jgi:hypothetical protein